MSKVAVKGNTLGNAVFTIESPPTDSDRTFVLPDNEGTIITTADIGTIASQDSDNVSISGGTIGGITDLAVEDGGTGASNDSDARVNLGLGNVATQSSDNINIDGGTIDGTAVNATTLTASGDVNFDSGALFVDASTNNVGIGTTAPNQKFHISGGKSIISSSNNGYGQIQVGNPTSNSETSVGFISGVTAFGGSPTSTNGDSHIWAMGSSIFNSGGNIFGIGNKNFGGPILNIIDDGNVGIGTINPTNKLDIETSLFETKFGVSCTSTNGRKWEIISGGSGGTFSGGRLGIYDRTGTNGIISFVGTTGSSAGGTTGKGVGFNHAGIWIDRGWGNNPAITITSTSDTGASVADQTELRIHGADVTWNSYPTSTGSDFSCDVRIDGSFLSSSDKRHKTNITSISNALDIVKSLEGKRFQTITSDGQVENYTSQNGYKFGFIAQDIETAGHGELYKHYSDYDDGTDGYNRSYSVNYPSVTAILVNAMKEQQSQIEELISIVNEMKSST